MSDIKSSFREIEDLGVPDLWDDIVRRAEVPSQSRLRSLRAWRIPALVAAVLAIFAIVFLRSAGPAGDDAAIAHMQAAAKAMKDPEIRFRFSRTTSDPRPHELEGFAVGQDRVQYSETVESQGESTREWLIVGRRAYLKGPGATVWQRWPFNKDPGESRGEPSCLSVGGEVSFVFEIADWLERCNAAWRDQGSETVDGVETIEYEFGGGEAGVTANVWIGTEDDYVYRFVIESDIGTHHRAVWSFWDYNGDFDIEEPHEFTGPGERGRDFVVGPKIVITTGEHEGRRWEFVVWDEEPNRHCQGLRFPEDRFGDDVRSASCGALPHEEVQGHALGYFGGGGSGSSGFDGVVDKVITTVRVYFRDGEVVDLATHPHPDRPIAYYVWVGERPYRYLEGLDASGRVLECFSISRTAGASRDCPE